MLCSDGLWSVLPEHVLIQHLHERTIVRAVPDLLNRAAAIAGKSADNLTALAMMWEGGDDNPSTISTNTLPIGAVTTTIHSTILDKEAASVNNGDEAVDGFDESDIEKAIEEIRNAIQKSSRVGLKG